MNQLMEAGFNPRVAVPHFAEIVARRQPLNERVRSGATASYNIRYGPGPRNFLDLYRGGESPKTLFVYVHGGYWRAGDKADFAFIAGPLMSMGAEVAILGYSLCPQNTVAGIVNEIALALTHLSDRPRIVLIGSSAGAHLVAMQLCNPDGPSIHAACLISGIYNLAPVLEVSVNETIGLRREDVEALSPMSFPERIRCGKLLFAVGGDEPAVWQQQTFDFAEKLGAETLVLADENHFSLTGLLGERNLLTDAILALVND